MTTNCRNTSRNSENIVACLVSDEGLLHACISSLLFDNYLQDLNYSLH